MKNTTYLILVAGLSLLVYLSFFSTENAINLSPQIQTQHSQAYSTASLNRKNILAGTYQTNNSISGFKDLILDSTYTYSYKVQASSGEEVVLEGSWELSYKDQDQHIVLHRPLPNQSWSDLKIAHLQEHKFRVTPNGLRDLYTQEEYLQIETDEYSLAIFNKRK